MIESCWFDLKNCAFLYFLGCKFLLIGRKWDDPFYYLTHHAWKPQKFVRCLTPFSTIFQLHRGDQFYWWRNLSQVTDNCQLPYDHGHDWPQRSLTKIGIQQNKKNHRTFPLTVCNISVPLTVHNISVPSTWCWSVCQWQLICCLFYSTS